MILNWVPCLYTLHIYTEQHIRGKKLGFQVSKLGPRAPYPKPNQSSNFIRLAPRTFKMFLEPKAPIVLLRVQQPPIILNYKYPPVGLLQQCAIVLAAMEHRIRTGCWEWPVVREQSQLPAWMLESQLANTRIGHAKTNVSFHSLSACNYNAEPRNVYYQRPPRYCRM